MKEGTELSIMLALGTITLAFGIFVGGEYQKIKTPVKYVSHTQVVQASPRYTFNELDLPKGTKGGMKTFMDYRAITDESSKQYALQQLAVTDNHGFRKFQDKYIVAVGTHYAKEVGKELIVTIGDAYEIKVVVGDIKRNKDTDVLNQYATLSGNIIEFIVDEDKLTNKVLRTGDVSSLGLYGPITKIEEVDNNV